jgi:ATP-dependent Lhr-like helicase
MREGDVEPTRVVQNALDVLAQVVVAMVAVDDWTSAELFDVVRQAYPYHALTRTAFDEVLSMLSGKYPSDVAAELDARLSWDRVADTLTPMRGSRMVAVISGGTIPDRGLYTVNLPDRTRLGELDEEFVHESRVGDVFQLGSSTWRIGAIEHDRVVVTPAPGAPARMPFWHGEYSARSSHLTARIGELRRELDAVRTEEQVTALAARYSADRPTTASLVEYVQQQRQATDGVPDERVLIVEQFRDEMDAVRLVVHAPFGGRVNAPWGMALAHRVREWLAEHGRSVRDGPSFELQVQTTDDGLMLRLPSLKDWLPISVIRDLTSPEAERRVLAEVGASSLFGARFRMNAGRALLLPRGSPRRRMPLWLQRLKALDLLQAVQEFPSFPILVETYRDVLQDAFDMPALSRVLDNLGAGKIALRSVTTPTPSPFAASLQFGFVMDWLYADDAPRAEQRAALLSLDRALLDEVMGAEGADESTLAMLDTIVGRRRGTVAGSRARSADELAVLLDRASDLTIAEIEARVATVEEGRRGEPLAELLERGRAIAIDIPRGDGAMERRVILTETFARYAGAFGDDAFTTVYAGEKLEPRSIADVVPESLRRSTVTTAAARRDLLARLVSLSSTISVSDVLARYAFDRDWTLARLDDWTRAGKLVRGSFGGSAGETRWASRRLLEQARRRELAVARKQIEAVELPQFARFMQRWQHVDSVSRADGDDGAARVVRQMYGLARPAEQWEREYLPARIENYDPTVISRLIAAGELVWIGGSADAKPNEAANLSTIRFARRGSARVWLPAEDATPPLGEFAQKTLDVLRQDGASFFDELQTSTSLSARALRDALRELVGAGLATNDTMESMRAVVRWRPFVNPRDRNQPDPTRWLPADFEPSANRYVVQRRPNLRRLPKWKRPDKVAPEEGGWPGRWSLVRAPRVLGPEIDESAAGELVARQWLERYGIVSREMWRRERPGVEWRAIYRELKRLEFRGEVRRGYFVRGLSGAQFALPEAVELLRSNEETTAAPVVMTASDPANVYTLPLAQDPARDAFVRPRSRGALLVSINGIVVMIAERRGERIVVRPGTSAEQVTDAAKALVDHLTRRTTKDLTVETIDGHEATSASHVDAFVDAGFRRGTRGLRYYRL